MQTEQADHHQTGMTDHGKSLLALLRNLLWRLPLRWGQSVVLAIVGLLALLASVYAQSLGLADGGTRRLGDDARGALLRECRRNLGRQGKHSDASTLCRHRVEAAMQADLRQ